MEQKTARRLLLLTLSASALLVSQCAFFQASIFKAPVYVHGNTAATTEDPVTLKKFKEVADSLHTPEMNAAIEAARRGGPYPYAPPGRNGK